MQQRHQEARSIAHGGYTLPHGKEKGDVKAQCLALNLKSDHYYHTDNIIALLKEKEKVADFARKTPYKQYIFGAWNRIITYYLRNWEYDTALIELKNIKAKPCASTILMASDKAIYNWEMYTFNRKCRKLPLSNTNRQWIITSRQENTMNYIILIIPWQPATPL